MMVSITEVVVTVTVVTATVAAHGSMVFLTTTVVGDDNGVPLLLLMS